MRWKKTEFGNCQASKFRRGSELLKIVPETLKTRVKADGSSTGPSGCRRSKYEFSNLLKVLGMMPDPKSEFARERETAR